MSWTNPLGRHSMSQATPMQVSEIQISKSIRAVLSLSVCAPRGDSVCMSHFGCCSGRGLQPSFAPCKAVLYRSCSI